MERTNNACQGKNRFTRCCKKIGNSNESQQPSTNQKIIGNTRAQKAKHTSDAHIHDTDATTADSCTNAYAVSLVDTLFEDDYVFALDGPTKYPRVQLAVAGSEVEFIADCRASVNVIDMSTYQSMTVKLHLKLADKEVFPYGSMNVLNLAEKFSANARAKNLGTEIITDFNVA